MPWGAVAGAAIGVVGNAMTDKGGGGGGSSTATKEPWADAAPWLRDNIKAGQDLQAQYAATPFNAQQLAAYGNMGRQTNYMNNLVPDLLGQIGNQGVGFDRSNTNARVTPYTFNGSGTAQPGGAQSGLLTQLTNPNTVSQYTSAANPPPPPPAPPPVAAPPSAFTAYDPSKTSLYDQARLSVGLGGSTGLNGGFGTFNYGDAVPDKNTQQYLDYQNFLLAGGDTMGRYASRDTNSGGA